MHGFYKVYCSQAGILTSSFYTLNSKEKNYYQKTIDQF